MTDPRIIECAKAECLAENGACECPKADGYICPSRIALAQAVILKWLEQEPTAAMIDAGPKVITAINVESGLHDASGKMEPVLSPQGMEYYTAMCAQAAKEISE